jgi:thiamine-phosphate diphosphorylase
VTARAERPLICLVTDRHRLRAPPAAALDALVTQIHAAARAGVDLIQIRERDLGTRALESLTTRAVAALSGTSSRVVINDRLDVALACGASGVHLRHDSVASDRVRGLAGPDFVIGRSVHSVEEAGREAAIGAIDFLIFGTVFNTASKPGAAATGLDGLARAAAAVRVPVLAIGGIAIERLHEVAQTGAGGIAAIGLFLPPADGDPIDALSERVRAIRHAFDTTQRLPGR